MQKKLLAVAVLSAFSGLASAQSANVTLYGTIVQHVEQVSATGGDSTVVGTGSSFRSTAAAPGTLSNVRVAAPAVGVAGVADQENRFRFNPAGTNFGLRGTEDLGNGLSAWFQIEMAVQMGNSPVNAGTVNGTGASYRNTAVGLRSRTWGTALFGMWDTPFNVMVGTLNANGRVGGASTGHHANLLGGNVIAQGAVSGQATGAWCTAAAASNAACANFGMNFDRRERSSMQWWSPNWNGFEVRGAYNVTADNGGITASNLTGGRNNLKQNIWDLSLTYTKGPLVVGYAYERQNDTLAAAIRTQGLSIGSGEAAGVGAQNGLWVFGTAVTATAPGASHMNASTGVGHRLGAKYAFGNGFGISGMWESTRWDMRYGVDAGAVALASQNLTSLKKTALRLQGNYTWASHFVGVDYVRASAMSGGITNALAGGVSNNFDGSSTGARAWQLHYNHSLSKRTSIGAYYNTIRNETNANYSGIVFGGIATAAGANPKYLGMQVRHSF